jgi:hypothetical protein
LDTDLGGVSEKSNNSERSLAAILGVNGPVESIEEYEGRVAWTVTAVGEDFPGDFEGLESVIEG